MKSVLAAVASAFIFVSVAYARPVILQETTLIHRPATESVQDFGRFGVAIDGDWALVSGERIVEADGYPNGRHEAAALLYLHSGTQWNFVGVLGTWNGVSDLRQPGLAMKNGVAVVSTDSTRIYELVGGVWTPSALSPDASADTQGADIEIDGGRVLLPLVRCSYDSAVLAKVNGVWTEQGELQGHANHCAGGTLPDPALQDLQDGRAAVFNQQGPSSEPARARLYDSAGGAWTEVAGITDSSAYFGPDVAMLGPYVAIGNKRERGTNVYYWPQGGAPTLTKYAMQSEDAYLGYPYAAWSVKRIGPYFGVRTYHWDINGSLAIDLYRINDDAVHSNTHVAILWPSRKGDGFLGDHIDASGNRVIVNNDGGPVPFSFVRIFDLPAELNAPAVQQYDFESVSQLADWQQSPGGLWSTTKVGYSNVYRQRTTVGSNWSLLPSTNRRDESIQADVTFRSMADTSAAWVGLVSRHKDDSNYYYAAVLSSGYVELRRVLNGKTVVRYRSAHYPQLQVGGKYRLRLESTGDEHRVFLDGQQICFAQDTTIPTGPVGLMTSRATADFDNVIVSPNWLTTIFANGFEPVDHAKIWHVRGGTWGLGNGVMTQTYTGGYARAFTGAPTEDQIISVRVKPTSFVADNYWVGVLARWQDERNHLYVSLEKRGVVSLWRRTNGVIQQLATQRYPIAVGTWYRVRVEIVNGLTRVFIDDQEILRTSADPGPTSTDGTPQKGSVGFITYQATAEYDDFLAYQP